VIKNSNVFFPAKTSPATVDCERRHSLMMQCKGVAYLDNVQGLHVDRFNDHVITSRSHIYKVKTQVVFTATSYKSPSYLTNVKYRQKNTFIIVSSGRV
jgi:hypothetical protein